MPQSSRGCCASFATRAAVVLVLILLLGVTTADAKSQCKTLRQLIKTRADFNSTKLGFAWFDQRLRMSKHYGCKAPNDDEEGPFHFAYGCGCEAWARCGGDNFEYEYLGRKYSARLGECKCCSGWLIALMVVVPLFIVIAFIRRKWIKKHIKDCWEGKSKQELKNSTMELKGVGEMEEGDTQRERTVQRSRSGTTRHGARIQRRSTKAKKYEKVYSPQEGEDAAAAAVELPPPRTRQLPQGREVSDRMVAADSAAFGEVMTSVVIDPPAAQAAPEAHEV